MLSLKQVLIGGGLAVLMAGLGYGTGALGTGGALGAIIVGSLIFGLGGAPWAALMVTFFISSSALSKMFPNKKAGLAEKFEKGSRRDWGQVFANGSLGAFLVIIHLLLPNDLWPWLAYAGAMATVTADTWATELGILSPVPPRLITTGKKVLPGTSGGVTIAGLAATVAGGALIGLVGWLFDREIAGLAFIATAAFAGLVGSLVDSLLGATVQAIYYDPVKDKETERRIHEEDGSLAAPVRGLDWVNNDMVNFFSSICGAVAAVLFWGYLV